MCGQPSPDAKEDLASGAVTKAWQRSREAPRCPWNDRPRGPLPSPACLARRGQRPRLTVAVRCSPGRGVS